jgi:hypothetical protein
MSKSPITPSNIKIFRGSVLAFACLLGGLAAWILAAELLCPPGIEFTTDAKSATSTYAHRDAATMAARVGLVRGDLWAKVAFTYGDMLWNQNKDTSIADGAPAERTRALAEQAIIYAPYDSRLWVLLAANYIRFDWLNERASASLRMSYYTGSNIITVVPVRLFLAVQSLALQDNDFQELVRHDIHLAVIHKSKLMPAIVAAYNDAPAAGKQFMEKAIAEFDPSVLALIRSQGQHR